jgi:hypothetical protein
MFKNPVLTISDLQFLFQICLWNTLSFCMVEFLLFIPLNNIEIDSIDREFIRYIPKDHLTNKTRA